MSDDCHITGKYRDSAHRDCIINLKLNNKILIVFHNLKNYDSHLIMQELGKFNLKISVIPNGLEKYMSFTITNNLIFFFFFFFDRFQFLSSSLGSLVINLNKNAFKHSSQEFDKKKLDLVKRKGFYPYEYATDFEKFKQKLPSKEIFYSSLTEKKISDKEYHHDLNIWNKFEMKTIKDYHDLYLKCDVLLLADVFEEFRNNSLRNYGLYPSHCLSEPGLN